MKTYIFKIQNCIKATVIADNKEAAREELIDNLEIFVDDVIDGCVVSDGAEVTKLNAPLRR